MTWYDLLVKPALNPPSWVFGPAWTVLYVLMAVAALLVWKKKKWNALAVFGIQLGLNLIWTPLFFGLHSPGWAFVDIVLLWAAIVWTIVAFSKVSKTAAWLLAPYILWVSFAAYLNLSVWMLN
jgi:translocator protein